MGELVLTTYDWVPELPRGYVRDLRIRWALEEAGLPYRVQSTPFKDRGPDHYAHHPFGQVPWLTDGDLPIFETGAILLHLGDKSEALMPDEPVARTEVIKWLFASLNSVEMAVLPWTLYQFTSDTTDTPGRQVMEQFLDSRLTQLEGILKTRTWLTDQFSIADIAMVDVLRLTHRFDRLTDLPACRAYITRATDRPAFQKAHADQMAHFG